MVGAILIIAITVILAAVLGTFVLGIGQDQQTTPSATFDFEYNGSGGVNVTHTGGDSFTTDNTAELTVNTSNGNSTVWPLPVNAGSTAPNAGISSSVSATSGDTVRVIWTAPGGGKTNTVGSFEVP